MMGDDDAARSDTGTPSAGSAVPYQDCCQARHPQASGAMCHQRNMRHLGTYEGPEELGIIAPVSPRLVHGAPGPGHRQDAAFILLAPAGPVRNICLMDRPVTPVASNACAISPRPRGVAGLSSCIRWRQITAPDAALPSSITAYLSTWLTSTRSICW